MFCIAIGSYFLDKLLYFGISKLESKVLTGQGVGKLNHFLQMKESSNYIILGSSRANHHLDPSFLNGPAYNMGLDGTKLAYAATLLKTLPQHKHQTVFFHIDPSSVFDQTYDGEDIKSLYTKYHKNDIIYNEINNISMNNRFSGFFYSLDYNGRVIGIIRNSFSAKYILNSYNGFDPLFMSKQQIMAFKRSLEHREQTNCEDQLKYNTMSLAILKDLKNFSRKNNKKVIFFTSPIYKDPCKKDIQALKRIMKELELEYHDFSGFFDEDNSFDNWKDAKHLSSVGAEKFSKEFFRVVPL